LKLDIAIIQNTKATNDFKSFEFDLICYLTSPVSESEFAKTTEMELMRKSIQRSFKILQRKCERSARGLPYCKKYIRRQKNNQFERIVVPFTDGGNH
jgi:preprotein translocase subunit SecA